MTDADDALEFVAFDIETTGFDAADEVTVIGFARSLGCRVFLQTAGRASDGLAETVDECVDSRVSVSTHECEAALLRAVGDFVDAHLEDVLLVAYNGELYRSGFDLPFLRTRYAACDVAWPFDDLPYADLLPIIRDRFNTAVEGEDLNDLPGAYEVLLGDGLNDLDPFTDSGEAVTAFEDGDFEVLVLHNVADVLRTMALGNLSQRYCSRSDYQLKSLTPTEPDP